MYNYTNMTGDSVDLLRCVLGHVRTIAHLWVCITSTAIVHGDRPQIKDEIRNSRPCKKDGEYIGGSSEKLAKILPRAPSPLLSALDLGVIPHC